jgi:hypothetical protein
MHAQDEGGRALFLPVLLLTITSLGWFMFQATQLLAERNTLRQSREAQQAQVQQSQQLRDSLDGLARDTARLAERGNPNAKLVVDELRKRGVTINPEAPPASPK